MDPQPASTSDAAKPRSPRRLDSTRAESGVDFGQTEGNNCDIRGNCVLGDVAASAAGRRRLVDGVLLWFPPLLCSAIFLPCLVYSEWYVDELFAVLRNEDARGETPLRQVFTNDFWGNPLRGSGPGAWTHKSYRPVSVLSFAWQFSLLEEGLFRPQPLRAFNVALHSANTLLLVALLRDGLHFSRCWSCLAACLFAAHPVHAENVVYLVGRADALATTGWLLAALAHLCVRRGSQCAVGSPPLPMAAALLLMLCALLAVLAGLCKESGLTLLVFVAGIELSSPQPGTRRGVCFAFAALGFFALLAVMRIQLTQGTTAAFGYVDTPIQYHSNFMARTLSYLFQHAFYAKLMVLPGDLSWDYSYDALPVLRATWRDVRMLAICSAYLALTGLAAWSLSGRGRRRALLGLQHVIVPFVPASNLFFKVGVTVGERLLYPSTVGFAMLVADLGEGLQRGARRCGGQHRGGGGGPATRAGSRRRGGGGRRWPVALAVALLCVYAWRCGHRVLQWRSSEALYAADAAAWPRSVKTRHQLGTVYHAQGRHSEALAHYNASLAVLDDNALTDHCIAQVYIETGRYGEALERFQKIFRGHLVGFSQFNLWMLYVDFGFTLVALSRFEEAVPPLKQGLGLNLAVPHGLNALGYAHASLEQLQEAQDSFVKALEYDPDNPSIWSNLAVVWMVAGAFQNAAHGLERALLQEPNHPVFVHNALLLKQAAEKGGAIEGRPRLDLYFSRTT